MSIRQWTAFGVVVTVAIALLVGVRGGEKEITAYFSSAVGLYPRDEVRVLGVKVGTVTKVEPQGEVVKVTLTVDDDQPIPADAQAAIIAPNLVNGRFVQLAPIYDGGDTLSDGDEIPVERTAVPISFDEVKQELTDLSTALTTNEAGQAPLSDVITALDGNLAGGTAQSLATSLASLREAATDLSSDSGDIFTTIDQLNTFTENLVVNDSALRSATQDLETFAGTLDGSSEQIGAAISTLQVALTDVGTFVQQNRETVAATFDQLVPVAETVANQSNDLAQLLHVAPAAVENFYGTVENSAITGRAQLANLNSTGELLCGLVLSIGPSAEACRQAVSPLFDLLGLEPLPLSPGTAELSQPGPGGSPQAPAPTATGSPSTNPLVQLLAPFGLLTTGGAP